MQTTWTFETMDDAKNKWEFVMVTPGFQPRVSIADAQSIWMTNPNIVFQTGYRIAGVQADIEASLLPLGVTPEDIQQLMDSSITNANFGTTMAPIYTEELNNYNLWKQAAVKANIAAPGAKLYDVMTAINPQVPPLTTGQAFYTHAATTARNPVGATTTARKPGGQGRGVVPLVDKINALAAGKVLDVSEITDKGTGVKTINRPQRGKKVGGPTLPIVSDNWEHYAMAINMIPGGQTQFADEIYDVYQLFIQPKAVRAPILVPAIRTPPAAMPPMPTTTPMIPQMQPAIAPYLIPVIHGTAIPQPEPITPTQVYPMMTAAQRKKQAAKKQTKPLTPVMAQFPGFHGAVQQPTITFNFPGGLATAPIPIPQGVTEKQFVDLMDDDYDTDEENDEDDEPTMAGAPFPMGGATLAAFPTPAPFPIPAPFPTATAFPFPTTTAFPFPTATRGTVAPTPFPTMAPLPTRSPVVPAPIAGGLTTRVGVVPQIPLITTTVSPNIPRIPGTTAPVAVVPMFPTNTPIIPRIPGTTTPATAPSPVPMFPTGTPIIPRIPGTTTQAPVPMFPTGTPKIPQIAPMVPIIPLVTASPKMPTIAPVIPAAVVPVIPAATIPVIPAAVVPVIPAAVIAPVVPVTASPPKEITPVASPVMLDTEVIPATTPDADPEIVD